MLSRKIKYEIDKISPETSCELSGEISLEVRGEIYPSLICVDTDQTFCVFCFDTVSADPENLTAVITLTVIWHNKKKASPISRQRSKHSRHSRHILRTLYDYDSYIAI